MEIKERETGSVHHIINSTGSARHGRGAKKRMLVEQREGIRLSSEQKGGNVEEEEGVVRHPFKFSKRCREKKEES